jgi:hypothetical protein
VIIPDRDPGEVLMRGEKIEISAVGGETLTVVVQSGDDSLGLGNTTNAPSITVVTVASVLVNVVAQVNDVVDRVLSHRISVGVEEAECCDLVSLCSPRQRQMEQGTEVAARVDGKSDLGSVIVNSRGRLGTAKDTGLVGAADVELVVVLGEGGQVVGLDLEMSVLVRRSK